MEWIRRVWVGVATTLLVLSFNVTVQAAEPSEEVRAYFRNGVELLQDSPPNYQDAYYQFKLAYEKSGGNWKVLGNLGLCAFKLERDSEAIQYYSEYLEKGEGQLSDEEMKQIRRDLLLIRGNLANVEITSNKLELELSIQRVGSSVPLVVYKVTGGKLTLSLRAGTQKIVAQAEGKQLVWEVPLAPGQNKTHEFAFVEDDAAVATTASPQSKDKPAKTSTKEPEPAAKKGGMSVLRIAGIATAVAGVGAIAGGAIFGLSANKKESDARGQADDPESCLENSSGDTVCGADAESAFKKAKTDALLSNILFIGGGVLTAAGVTMIVLGGNNNTGENPSASLELAPSVTPLGGGIVAFGRF
jgi:hypothetical protein